MPLVISLGILGCNSLGQQTDEVEDLRAATQGLADVGGYELYYSCRGEGTPTVVFDAGLGVAPREYAALSVLVSKTTRICFYERAGFGRSGTNRESNTAMDAAKDLRRLLAEAGIPGPYLLVGHSIGSYTVIMFADMFPDEVAAVLVLDGSGISGDDYWSEFVTPSPEETELAQYIDDSPWGEEFQVLESLEQVKQVKTMGEIPITVLTAEIHDEGMSEKALNAFNSAHWADQAQIAALSKRSRHILVEEGGHLFPISHPEVVLDAIEQLLEIIHDE